ncbi:sensor histidine kinase [Marinoscillum pacificum]|uniref:sensor histidine kinase n=1 Tax=Marinoscillum pacificum TaxID=392723 RepID=UPI0021577389|nr:histidine kinase [Marinoscillum pacificum]
MRFLKERYVRWVGIFIVAFIVTFFDEGHEGDIPYWYRYGVSWLFTAVYWNGAYLIFMMFRKLYPEISKTFLRLIITYVVLFIWMTVGGVPIKLLLGVIDLKAVCTLGIYTEYLVLNLVIAIMVGTMYETVFFFEKWKDAIRQNEELKNQQIRTQFEVLQNQMSPHFLFNSLNTLTTLIAENQDLALEFTEKLSDVYRYILQNKQRELVTLNEELQFVKDYLYLLKIRFPENLNVDFSIPEKCLKMHIAPLTLQMLIENSIKHNVISKAHPLSVDVYITDGCIVVRNNLKLKQVLDKSTKTGLDNIRKRYEYLSDSTIEVIETSNSFIVSVPLIVVKNEEN